MQIRLERTQFSADVTLGRLLVDGKFECWVCEDAVREIDGKPVAEWKVPGKTAIPFGMYDIVITMSNRFKVRLPLLQAVPGFEGIRIHPGNTAADTEGCLLPGLDRLGKGVGRSRLAFDALFAKIDAALTAGERVLIHVVRDESADAT